MRPIVGVEAVVVVVVGVSSWVSPGIAVESVFIPRPLVELPPELLEPDAATPDSGTAPEDVPDVGLESAPANDNEVAGAVVVVDVLAGATVLEVVEF